ncbi:MAG: hypothetical protein ISS15_12185 [Alphaproteobacteria bacterium]|nr:hypothetical protein [Alphaproteobacteria bacterium]MBL6936540.1 hypothetical protein [Alphaproteobacteria bacterium]MBL7098409.1 hypothetical protein [Alphaproteobacteria bacterium]
MTRLTKVLIAGATVTVVMPAAVGAMMLSGRSDAPDEAQVQAAVSPPSKPELGTLGRATAVAWLSAGHVSAVP